jgi:hypothetical protein
MDYNTNPTIQQAVNARYQAPASACPQIHPHWKFDPLEKSDVKINYVFAAWAGKRRKGNDQYHRDLTFYVKNHLKSLEVLKHDLSQITLAVNASRVEPKYFTDYISELPDNINGTPLVVIRRHNKGQSYGAYSDAFLKYGNNFDYFIFIEDDYIFVQDNFDQILLQMYNSAQDCGFLCSYVSKWPNKINGIPHAAISNGMSSTATLKKVIDTFGCLPSVADIVKICDADYRVDSQVNFSHGFLKTGTKIYDYLLHYNAPFNDVGHKKLYGSASQKSLIVPLQFPELYEKIIF